MKALFAVLLAGTASAQMRSVPRAALGGSGSAAAGAAAASLDAAPSLAPALSVLPLSAAASETPAPQPGGMAQPADAVPAARPNPSRHDGLALGVLEDAPKKLAGMTFRFNEWNYLSFAIVTEDPAGLGKATTNGAPASESKLEHKHVVREYVADGKRLYRHDYGWLALGSTPEGEYAVAFPDKGFSFKATMTRLDQSTREQRKAAAAALVREVFSAKEPEMEFGPGVSEQVKAFMGPHMRIMDKNLEDYEQYVREDPLLDEPGRAARLLELENLRALQADVVAGRSHYTALSPIVAQLMAREAPMLEAYKRYMLDNPAVGKASGEMHIQQIDQYSGIMAKLHEVYSQVERRGPPGAFAKAVGKTVELWARLRAWLKFRFWR